MPTLNLDQLQRNPRAVAELQERAAQECAATLSGPATSRQSTAAEMLMRNPTVYARDHQDAIRKLPAELQGKWRGLDSFCNALASVNDEGHQWMPVVNGIGKVQYLMSCNQIGSEWMGALADVLRESSKVFAASIRLQPVDTHYFAGNAYSAASRVLRDSVTAQL